MLHPVNDHLLCLIIYAVNNTHIPDSDPVFLQACELDSALRPGIFSKGKNSLIDRIKELSGKAV